MKPCLALFMFMASTSGAVAAIPFSFKPTLFHPDDGPALVGALKFESEAKKEWMFTRPDRGAFIGYKLAGSISTRPESNEGNTTADARLGFEWRADPVPPPSEVFPGSGNTSNTGVPTPPARTPQWGSFSTELAAGFETDEPLDNRQWAYGLRVNYTPAFDRSDEQWWIPHVWLDYRRINEAGSKVSEKLGLPNQDYWRFGSSVYWVIPGAAWASGGTFWKQVKLVPGLHYYRSTDLALTIKQADLDDAYYYSFRLVYTVPENSSLGRKLSSIEIGISNGRIPPAPESRTVFSVSLTVKWDQLLK